MSDIIKSHSRSLNEWLSYLETIHSTEIDLGLSRIAQVAVLLNVDLSFATVITVAGTNGKGTTCAFLENAFMQPECIKQLTMKESITTGVSSVAVYSSPHINRFNERLRVDKKDVCDEFFIEAFELIEKARGDISLSYYEYTTLAAFLIMMKLKPSIIILEVGLGGRLDATNIIDADVGVVTTIDLDHQAFLGNDRESIGYEKAGIMRAEQLIVVGDTDVPASVVNYGNSLVVNSGKNTDEQLVNNNMFIRERDFQIVQNSLSNWSLKAGAKLLENLKPCHIPQDNVATALMVLYKLGVSLNTQFVNMLIGQTKVSGRTELFTAQEQANFLTSCDVVLDVGHNPQATRYLAKQIKQYKRDRGYKNIHAVVAMLADKDIENSLKSLIEEIDVWYIGQLDVPRASSTKDVANIAAKFANSINCFDNVSQAFKIANHQANSDDLILVFGSFFTVAEVRELLV
ncbi:bifunctional tetrahydrofolate synthase/dihydrofolate synthase [Litorilituus lipolyticus]|uniref:Dihydrofolate synthase/folylpolyglutamate synthase n=1 Tax=Litorilituus lipolyticus TaxID=2491017 RepID=A0A502L5K0_9GAMM|nr:bifunctional tetrahydrofolate synthase/dihydrofolate synthase [Litorilituus lipolyticus]TPH19198.1 bifunctional tetrahydrofolate synthase/dihydrofolate synthase [Litorilituus lipolyticus]